MMSSRLPGKVMEKVGGHTVLFHVLRRCQAIPGIDVVCCATTESAESDVVADEASRCEAEVFRGSESDVLDRYHRAARHLGAEVVLRVTSDCPLIDPEICARVLDLRDGTGADYACNNMPRSWPHGLDCEAFTTPALTRAATEAHEPEEREHVTPWLRRDPSVRRANLEGPGGAAAAQRWTLDYPEDLEFLRAVFDRLPPWPALPGFDEVLALLEREPELAVINARHRAPPAATSAGPSNHTERRSP